MRSFAYLVIAPAKLGAHSERAHGTRAARSAECKLTDNSGRADENYEYEIRDEKGQTAPCGYEHRETPDVAHADRRAYTGDDKSASAFKAVTALQ